MKKLDDYLKAETVGYISLSVFLDYEIKSSWFASWVSCNYGKKLCAKYFVWKVKRKYSRYIKFKEFQQMINNNR